MAKRNVGVATGLSGPPLGAQVEANELVYRIINVEGDVQDGHVSLEQYPVVAGTPLLYVRVEDFVATWALADPRAVVELHSGWPAFRSSQTELGRILRGKGCILTGLGILTELLDESSSAVAKLAVHTKPIRRVVATGHHAVAEVHLAPETTNVKRMTDKELAAASPEEVAAMVEVKLEPPAVGLRFFWFP